MPFTFERYGRDKVCGGGAIVEIVINLLESSVATAQLAQYLDRGIGMDSTGRDGFEEIVQRGHQVVQHWSHGGIEKLCREVVDT